MTEQHRRAIRRQIRAALREPRPFGLGLAQGWRLPWRLDAGMAWHDPKAEAYDRGVMAGQRIRRWLDRSGQIETCEDRAYRCCEGHRSRPANCLARSMEAADHG